MIAKVRTLEVPVHEVEAGVTYLRTQMLPAARQVEGFHGMIGLVDRERGKAVTVTLWASEEALNASEAAGARSAPAVARHRTRQSSSGTRSSSPSWRS